MRRELEVIGNQLVVDLQLLQEVHRLHDSRSPLLYLAHNSALNIKRRCLFVGFVKKLAAFFSSVSGMKHHKKAGTEATKSSQECCWQKVDLCTYRTSPVYFLET